MADLLFVTWDGGGNVPPALGIAATLVDRGQHVRFLGHERQRSSIEAFGFPFDAYQHAVPWSAVKPTYGAEAAAEIFAMFTDGGPGTDLHESVTRAHVDAVVIDAMSLGALQAAQQLGVPVVALMHTYSRFFALWGRGPIGQQGASQGRAPEELWAGCDAVLVATDHGLDAVDEAGLPKLTQVGVVQSSATSASAGQTPRVLVSLSTIFYGGQSETLQSVLDGLAELDCEVVVTTGDTIDPADLRGGPRVHLHRHLPHDQVMASVSLLIGHGGHSTTMRALAHDVPVLVLPMHPMLDHLMIGESVAAQGAGEVLARDATPHQIADTVSTLLTQRSYGTAAGKIGARIRSHPGQLAATDLIEQLLTK